MKSHRKNKNLTGRREVLGYLWKTAPALLLAGKAGAQGRGLPNMFAPEVPERENFFFAQLVYGSDNSWNPHPTAARSLMEMLVARTSIPASPDRVDMRVDDERLFYHPFLYWTGTREFDPLPEAHVERLRRYMEAGGFLLVDDALSASGVGFDKAFQRELARIFPGRTLEKLPQDHTINQSYYLLDKAAGRTANRPYLMGVDIGDRTALVYSANDMGGAWARDRAGQWENNVTPGGSLQRELAVRVGINLVLYSLCVDYKKDLIHVPFISDRRSGRRGSP